MIPGYDYIDYQSNTREFKQFMDAGGYDTAFIFGNGTGLMDIDDEWVKANKTNATLSIGLNRSYRRLFSDYLFFTDMGMVDEALAAHNKGIKIVRIEKTSNLEGLQYWKSTKTLAETNPDVLIVFRNILLSALDMCSQMKIKKVFLFGVDMDNRTYFYGKHPNNYEPTAAYDKTQLLGYDTHTIIKELIELWFGDRMKLYYTGKSNFLSTVNKIERIAYEEICKIL